MLHQLSDSAQANDRIAFLEEENRQLREMLGLDDDAGFIVAARKAFDATPTQARMLQVLVTREVSRHELLMNVCGSVDTATPNNVKVQLSKLRAKLAPCGIVVKNRWGIGYGLTPAHRSMVLDMMASAAESEDGEAHVV